MSLNLKWFVIFSQGLSGGVSPDHRFKKNKKNFRRLSSGHRVKKNKKI